MAFKLKVGQILRKPKYLPDGITLYQIEISLKSLSPYVADVVYNHYKNGALVEQISKFTIDSSKADYPSALAQFEAMCSQFNSGWLALEVPVGHPAKPIPTPEEQIDNLLADLFIQDDLTTGVITVMPNPVQHDTVGA